MGDNVTGDFLDYLGESQQRSNELKVVELEKELARLSPDDPMYSDVLNDLALARQAARQDA